MIVGVAVAAAVVLLAAFVFVEWRQDNAMFDLSLFRKPAFSGVSYGTFAIGAGMFAMFLYITIYMQSVIGMTPLEAGVRFLPLTLFAFIVPLVTRNLVAKVPARVPLTIGLTLVGVGLLLMRGAKPDSEWTTLLAGFIVSGFGIGLSNPSIASTALGVVPAARSGMASGINNTMRIAGVATGIAALGAVFQSKITDSLHTLLPQAPSGFADGVAASGTQAASQAPPQLHDQAFQAAGVAFTERLQRHPPDRGADPVQRRARRTRPGAPERLRPAWPSRAGRDGGAGARSRLAHQSLAEFAERLGELLARTRGLVDAHPL